MENGLKKIFKVPSIFKKHFNDEMSKYNDSMKKLSNMKSKISDSVIGRISNRISESLKFCDFIFYKIISQQSIPSSMRNNRNCYIDKFIEKKFYIPQYYGGIKENLQQKNQPWVSTLLKSLTSKLPAVLISKPIEYSLEYEILETIQNQKLPLLLKKFFEFQDVEEEIKLDVRESLKKMKDLVLAIKPMWTAKKIKLVDIREVKVDNIEIKNLKKTISIGCEISLVLEGTSSQNIGKSLTENFSVLVDFTKENGEWIATNLSYNIIK